MGDAAARLESHIRALALPARRTRVLLRQSRSDDVDALEDLRGTLAAHGVLVPARTACAICCDVLGEAPFQRLRCGHAYHAACLARMAACGNAHVPRGHASARAWDAWLHCPACKAPLAGMGLGAWLDLGPMLRQRARLARLEREYVAVEFDTPAQRAAALAAMQGQAHFHFCGACRQPQLLLQSASCAQQQQASESGGVVLAGAIDPCPHCHPEHYEVRCPCCGARLWRAGGCRSMRCCAYGENCGLDRKKTVTVYPVEGDRSVTLEVEVPDPQPCDHGGHGCCGAAFLLQPRVQDVDARVPQEALDRFLRALHPGSGSLLLHHLTRHDLHCLEDGCPACVHARRHHRSPWLLQELRQRQFLLEFLALERRQRRLARDRRLLARQLTRGASSDQDSEEASDDDD